MDSYHWSAVADEPLWRKEVIEHLPEDAQRIPLRTGRLEVREIVELTAHDKTLQRPKFFVLFMWPMELTECLADLIVCQVRRKVPQRPRAVESNGPNVVDKPNSIPWAEPWRA